MDDLRRVRERIRAASGAPGALRSLYVELENELGRDRASWLWWAAFAAEDATHT